MEKFLQDKLSKRYKKSDLNVFKIIVSYLDFSIGEKVDVYIPPSYSITERRGMQGNKGTYYTCQCGEHILYENQDQHEELDCTQQPRSCFECNIICETKEELLAHKKDLCAFSTYTCKFCNIGSFYLKNLWSHYKSCKKTFYCEICEVYYNKENLGLHKYYHKRKS